MGTGVVRRVYSATLTQLPPHLGHARKNRSPTRVVLTQAVQNAPPQVTQHHLAAAWGCWLHTSVLTATAMPAGFAADGDTPAPEGDPGGVSAGSVTGST